jgi:hypothetical protein
MATQDSGHRKGIGKPVESIVGIRGIPKLLDHRSDQRPISLEQLSKSIGERVKMTLMLAHIAHYYPFVYDTGPVVIKVEGAAYQDKSYPREKDRNGRTVYTGLEAGHIRLGSYWINEGTVAAKWETKFADLAAAHDVPKATAYAKGLQGHGHLAATSLLLEGRTHPVDILINQTFGTIEKELHPLLTTLNLSSVPQNEELLARAMKQFDHQFCNNVPQWLLEICERRYTEIKGTSNKERIQKNTIYEGYGPLFTGEKELLDYLIAEFESSRSEITTAIEKQLGLADQGIGFDMTFVVKAKEEAISVSEQNHTI